MGKIKAKNLFDRSCDSCAYAKEVWSKNKYVKMVFCRFKNKETRYVRLCPHHANMNCHNCKFCKSIEYEGKKKRKEDDGGIHYKYWYLWKIDCERYDESIDVKEEGLKRKAYVPYCSLWEFKEESK